MARLVQAGLTPDELARLRSPIGLDLGARTPEETAVSIAAEIIAGRWGGSGEPLTETMLKAIGGIKTVEILTFTPLLDGTFANAKQVAFDRNKSGTTAGKIHFFDAAGTETAGSTDLHTFTCSFRLVGY